MAGLGKLIFLTNRLIAPIGIELRPLVRDFDSRFLNRAQARELSAALAEAFERFLAEHDLFPRRANVDLVTEIEEFYENYLSTPICITIGGNRFNNLLV